MNEYYTWKDRNARVREYQTAGTFRRIDGKPVKVGPRRRHATILLDGNSANHGHHDDDIKAYLTTNEDGSLATVEVSWPIETWSGEK